MPWPRLAVRFRQFVVLICLSACSAVGVAEQIEVSADHAKQMQAGVTLFRQSVRDILSVNCLKCHNARSAKADFDLSSRKALLESGHLGSSSADSSLMQLVRHQEEPHMPLKAPKLAEDQIEALARWIDLGAPYDKPFAAHDREQPREAVTDEDRQFWSFAPLIRPDVPSVNNSDWCRTKIDRFILAQLEQAGIGANPRTDRRLLIRRAYYDLLGLPPNPLEVDQFLADPDSEAYDRLIDRLLNSRHYGERWARHWLDIARFAESTGFEHDDDRPHAYHYRDFVIKAFNQDLPFDEFIRWQLAGDELAPDNSMAMMATGFLGAGPSSSQLTEAEFESARYDEIDDMVSNTGLAFLGLSVGCARCHDHKYDPIPAVDYYAMAATFGKTVRSEIDLVLEPASPVKRVQVTAEGFEPIRNHAHGRGYPYFYDQVHFLRRGDVHQKEQVCSPGFVQVLLRSEQPATQWAIPYPDGWQRSDFRRAALAHWITDSEFGAGHLAARVIVNRLWQHHFGRGLVATPNDFGMQGERPTHPKLLDWLAVELIENDWSLKHVHQLIMKSSVWVQSDRFDEHCSKVDRDNRLHWRRSPRRLEAEAIRDAMLAVSGQLDTTMYGPGTLDEGMRRRSIYFTVKRSKLIPMMMLFDWPEHLVSIGQRPITTTPPQALLFMNNANTRTLAKSFANRLSVYAVAAVDDRPADFSGAIEQAYRIAYGRPASKEDVSLATSFLNRQLTAYSQTDSETSLLPVLTDFAQMILSSSEFIFVR